MTSRPSRRRLLQAALAAGAAPALLHWSGMAGAAEVDRFSLGVASGAPTSDGVVLWTRLTGIDLPPRVEVEWELAHDEAFSRIAARGQETALAADAHSVHAEPRGLDPGRGYFYRFIAMGQASPGGRTRTAPATDAQATLRFAIASCQRYDHGHYAAWRDVAAADPDLVVFLGDYIYEYPSPADAVRPHEGPLVRTLAQFRARYAQYKSDALLQAAHAACPWAPIWDDHEVANDHAGLLGEDERGAFAALRAAAYQAWWEHMPVPKAMRPRGPFLPQHRRLDWGALARFHLLDTRQQRDLQACQPVPRARTGTVRLSRCPDLADPKRSMLGAAQEQWLTEGLADHRPWQLLAQTTLMSRLSSGGDDPLTWADGWDGYAPARRRLLDAAVERQAAGLAGSTGGLVSLGGDVHAHYVSPLLRNYDAPDSTPVGSEFCGASIASRGLPQWQVEAIRRLNPHVSFGRSVRGSVLFRLDAKALQADLRGVHNALDAASPVRSVARFVVEAGRQGPQAS